MQALLQDGSVGLPLPVVLLIAHCHLPLTSSITSVVGWRLPHALLDLYEIIHSVWRKKEQEKKPWENENADLLSVIWTCTFNLFWVHWVIKKTLKLCGKNLLHAIHVQSIICQIRPHFYEIVTYCGFTETFNNVIRRWHAITCLWNPCKWAVKKWT